MKTLKIFFVLSAIFLAVFSLSLINSKNEITTQPIPTSFNITDNQFMIYAMDVGIDKDYTEIPELHMNAWQKYTHVGLPGYPVAGLNKCTK